MKFPLFGYNVCISKRPRVEDKPIKESSIECIVYSLLITKLGIPEGVTLDNNTIKYDLWMDSLDNAEFLITLEDEFNIEFSCEEFKWETLGGLLKIIEEKFDNRGRVR